jgi:hypothetical protein
MAAGASASGLESIDMMDIPKRTAEELMEIQGEWLVMRHPKRGKTSILLLLLQK